MTDKTYLVYDHNGLFVPLALKLRDSGAEVIYQTPPDRRDQITESIIADGIKGILVTDDYWGLIANGKKFDCAVFPDVRHAGDQAMLKKIGVPVWGAGRGMALELDREYFLKMLSELSLDVPLYDVVVGLQALATYLRGKRDIWIKTSKWRGSWETAHWRSWDEDSHLLDVWAVRFGGIKEIYRFICFPKIETDLEIGADTFCIDGEWPDTMLHGLEAKDKAYFAAVTPKDKMPEQLLPIMDAFSPYLKSVGYRSQWSMEVRVKEPYHYFIDATTRGGLPSTGSQILGMKNLAEVIYHGARGEMLQPDYDCLFTAECRVSISGKLGAWATEKFDPSLKPHLMLEDYCEVNGQPWWPAEDNAAIEGIGWLVSKGQTPKECLESMNELADKLPSGCDAAVESLADIIREIDTEHESGIKFTEQEIPSPEIVLEPS